LMSAQHMVEHLEYFLRMSWGEIPTEIITPEKRLEKYQESLFNYRPMPKNFEHPQLPKGKTVDLRFKDLEEAKAAFFKAYAYFEAYYKENPTATHPHSIFGELDHEMWELLHRKHFDHHFRQFGLV